VSDITIVEPTTKPRKGTSLSDRLCGTRVAKRVKYYDNRCRGLYVSITPTGIATFSCNFTNAAGRPTSGTIGIHHPELFKVADARAKVSALKAKGGSAISEILGQQKSEAIKRGVTVDEVIAARVEWMKTLVKKADHEMRPRVESWPNVKRHLERLVSPRLGRKIASEVTNSDIATLSNDIVAGRHIHDGKVGKPSVSNARHMRRASSAMFKCAALAGNDFVKESPCVNLPPLEKEPPRSRVLTADEIRILWLGLDRNDLPWDRTILLAIKFALVTILRSWEMLGIQRDELNPDYGTVDIPARRVKKRRVINQPLSDLALEILTESMGNYDFAFVGRFGDAPLARQAMSGALKGTKHRNGKVRTPGIAHKVVLRHGKGSSNAHRKKDCPRIAGLLRDYQLSTKETSESQQRQCALRFLE
jgi:integrase